MDDKQLQQHRAAEGLMRLTDAWGAPTGDVPPAIPVDGGSRRTVTFQPATHPRAAPIRGPLPPMEGELTAYGLVIHPSCSPYCRDRGFFDVSDPITGARVCDGTRPGRESAVDALAQFVREYYGKNPAGDFREALRQARQNLAKPEDFYHPYESGK